MVFPRQEIPIVEKERFFVADLGREYVLLTLFAFTIINICTAGSGKTILWYAVYQMVHTMRTHIMEKLFYYRGRQTHARQVGHDRLLLH